MTEQVDPLVAELLDRERFISEGPRYLLQLCARAAERIAALTAERDEANRKCAVAKADEVYAAKLMLKFRTTLSNISKDLEDEGDRVHFGSTNDADQLREITEAVEDLEWGKILASSQKKPDLYADLRELRASLSAAEARLADALAALDEAEACMSIVEPRSDKAEYLRILGVIRATLSRLTAAEKKGGSE